MGTLGVVCSIHTGMPIFILTNRQCQYIYGDVVNMGTCLYTGVSVYKRERFKYRYVASRFRDTLVLVLRPRE